MKDPRTEKLNVEFAPGTESIPNNSGIYSLILSLDKNVQLLTRGLKRFDLQKGYYIYIGSAMNGLRNRIFRYLRIEYMKKFWHIDYLLEYAKILYIIFSITKDRKFESVLANEFLKINYLKPVPKFGCSDTKDFTHLFYLHSFDQKVLNDVINIFLKYFDKVYIVEVMKPGDLK